MFGFQRICDLAWAAGDSRTRGFLLGATSGRTTLNGEGLQHEDGHSQVMAGLVPNCISYDPTYAGEVAVIIQDGLRRMFYNQEDVYYYITLMNENYQHPKIAAGVHADLLKGLYQLHKSNLPKPKAHIQLLGSGAILNEVVAAAALLAQDFGVAADVWSATSFNLLARDGRSSDRHNMLATTNTKPKLSHVAACLEKTKGPIVAASDYVRLFSEQIRAYLPAGRQYMTLGTDGYGRSDTRTNLRSHFEVDRFHIAYAAVRALVNDDDLAVSVLKQAAKKYSIDPAKPDPFSA